MFCSDYQPTTNRYNTVLDTGHDYKSYSAQYQTLSHSISTIAAQEIHSSTTTTNNRN